MKSRNAAIRHSIEENAVIFKNARRLELALQIRRKMTEKGLRNVDIAERLGVSEANVSRWLRGNQNLSLDTIYQLTDAMEESLRFVVGTQEQSNSQAFDLTLNEDDNIEAKERLASIPSNSSSPLGGAKVFLLDAYRELREQVSAREIADFVESRGTFGIPLTTESELAYK